MAMTKSEKKADNKRRYKARAEALRKARLMAKSQQKSNAVIQQKKSKPVFDGIEQTVKSIDAKKYVLPKTNKEDYVDSSKLFEYLEHYSSKSEDRALLLFGSAGTGKTSGVKEYARKIQKPILVQPCGARTDIYDLLVEKELETDKDGKTKTIRNYGFFPALIECANQEGLAFGLLDEINMLSIETQTELNERMSKLKDGLQLPNTDKIVRLNEGCKVVIVGTMNPPEVNSNVNDLSIPLRDRFAGHRIEKMSENKLKKLLQLKIDPKDDPEILKFIDGLLELSKKADASFYKDDSVNALDMPLSVRSLVAIANTFKIKMQANPDIEKAIEFSVGSEFIGKYTDSEIQNTARVLADRILGVKF